MAGLREEGKETWVREERVREVEAVVVWRREKVVGVVAEAIVVVGRGVQVSMVNREVD